jgi:hypothetical protein
MLDGVCLERDWARGTLHFLVERAGIAERLAFG